jgi:hypothetical protein
MLRAMEARPELRRDFRRAVVRQAQIETAWETAAGMRAVPAGCHSRHPAPRFDAAEAATMAPTGTAPGSAPMMGPGLAARPVLQRMRRRMVRIALSCRRRCLSGIVAPGAREVLGRPVRAEFRSSTVFAADDRCGMILRLALLWMVAVSEALFQPLRSVEARSRSDPALRDRSAREFGGMAAPAPDRAGRIALQSALPIPVRGPTAARASKPAVRAKPASEYPSLCRATTVQSETERARAPEQARHR